MSGREKKQQEGTKKTVRGHAREEGVKGGACVHTVFFLF